MPPVIEPWPCDHRPVRIGVQLQPQHGTYAELRDAALAAEDLGVDLVLTWDHLWPVYGDPAGRHHECWTTLAAWAEATSRVQIGPLVSCVAYRSPQLLAEMVRTVADIAEGRLMLGLGAGWFEQDFDWLGIPFKPDGERLDDLARALPIIANRLTDDHRAPIGTVPLMIGGAGPRKTLPIVARHADIWHSFSTEVELEELLPRLRECCAEAGRTPCEVEVGVAVGGGDRNWRAPGAPVQWGGVLLDQGVTLFTLSVGGPEYRLDEVVPWLRWREEINAERGVAR